MAASCRGTCTEPSCRPVPARARPPGVGRAALPWHAGTVCGLSTGWGTGLWGLPCTGFLCPADPFPVPQFPLLARRSLPVPVVAGGGDIRPCLHVLVCSGQPSSREAQGMEKGHACVCTPGTCRELRLLLRSCSPACKREVQRRLPRVCLGFAITRGRSPPCSQGLHTAVCMSVGKLLPPRPGRFLRLCCTGRATAVSPHTGSGASPASSSCGSCCRAARRTPGCARW